MVVQVRRREQAPRAQSNNMPAGTGKKQRGDKSGAAFDSE